MEECTYFSGALNILCVRGDEAGLVLVGCRHLGIGLYLVIDMYKE
jgi:hypothetical protein